MCVCVYVYICVVESEFERKLSVCGRPDSLQFPFVKELSGNFLPSFVMFISSF